MRRRGRAPWSVRARACTTVQADSDRICWFSSRYRTACGVGVMSASSEREPRKRGCSDGRVDLRLRCFLRNTESNKSRPNALYNILVYATRIRAADLAYGNWELYKQKIVIQLPADLTSGGTQVERAYSRHQG